jgi:hypothetical protein
VFSPLNLLFKCSGLSCLSANSATSILFTSYLSILGEGLNFNRIFDQVLPNDIAFMSPSQPRKESTKWINPWSLAANMDVDSREIAECPAYCSELTYNYLKFNHSAFVIVKIAVIWGRKYCYYCRKLFRACPMIHFKSICLGLMRSYDRQ